MHPCKSALVILALTVAGCGGNPAGPDVPLVHPVPAPPAIARYADNTPSATRDAHRQAVAAMRNGNFADACATLDGVPQGDRRSLTEYLTVLCTARQADVALKAEGAAQRISNIGQPPPLVDPELASLNRHRAWVAAIQDSLADAAKAHFNLPGRPLPDDLKNSKDLARIVGYRQRGIQFDAATYNATFNAMNTQDLALSNLLANLTVRNANAILFADLTGMHVPPPPAIVLPADSDL